MTTQASNHMAYLLAHAFFTGDTIKIALMDTGFEFDKDAHAEWADVSGSELGSGNGYTTGGNTLSGIAISEDDTNDRAQVSWSNTTWTADGGNIGPTPGAIIYNDSDDNDPIIGYIDFGGEQTQADGGTATISNIKFRISTVVS